MTRIKTFRERYEKLNTEARKQFRNNAQIRLGITERTVYNHLTGTTLPSITEQAVYKKMLGSHPVCFPRAEKTATA